MRGAGVLRLTIALGLAVSAAKAQELVRFDVPEPFRVGSHTYSGGTISVHAFRNYNPTTSLLEITVNGECIGMMTAHRDLSALPPARNEALFDRDADGRLVMTGYRTAGRPASTTFRFQEPAVALGSAPTASLIGSD